MTWSLAINNVAGILSGNATIKPGVNAVRASNWQGKSSFIKAIQAAMGTSDALTVGETSGSVELMTADGTYTVSFSRSRTGVTTDGTPYLAESYDRRCAELFAFLDEDNAVREAVRSGMDLEAVLTEPLELANIDSRITALQNERDRLREAQARAHEAREQVTELTHEVSELEAELDDLIDQREALTPPEEDAASLDALRDELSDIRSERAQLDDLIDRTTKARDRIQERLTEKYESIEAFDSPESDDLDARLDERRDAHAAITEDIDLLESMYAVNTRLIEEDRLHLVSDVDHDLLDDHLDCWICGNEATRETILEQLESIRTSIEKKRTRKEASAEAVEKLKQQKAEREEARKAERTLQTEIQQLEDTLADREATLSSAKERLAVVVNRLEDVEASVETTDDRRTELESSIKYTERQLADRKDALGVATERAERVDELSEELDDIETAIEQLRTKRDRIRENARRAFDVAINDVVSRFETSFESAHLTGTFELVVARDGRSVPLSALSEGEVELLGIVAALAGYEAYDVSDLVPVMLLDALGGLADENVQTLVEYLAPKTTYLVMTTYPENVAVGEWELDPSEWTVVSNRVQVAD